MSATGIILFSLACVVSMTMSKPTGTGDEGLDASCYMDYRRKQQGVSVEIGVISSSDFICGANSAGLLTELLGIADDTGRIKAKVEDSATHSTILLHYINSSIPNDTTSKGSDKLSDYLVSIYGLMKNVTISLDELKNYSVYTRDAFDFIRDDIEQLSLETSRIACSMVVNGLIGNIDVSNIPIGVLSMVSACAVANVNDVDVLQMIHEFVEVLQLSADQAYTDISNLCNKEMTTQVDIAAVIVG